jgi:hypothetical protein
MKLLLLSSGKVLIVMQIFLQKILDFCIDLGYLTLR